MIVASYSDVQLVIFFVIQYNETFVCLNYIKKGRSEAKGKGGSASGNFRKPPVFLHSFIDKLF